MARYKVHAEDGSIQDMETMGVFDPNALQIDANEYRAWLERGNVPDPMDPDPALVVDEVQAERDKVLEEIIDERLTK